MTTHQGSNHDCVLLETHVTARQHRTGCPPSKRRQRALVGTALTLAAVGVAAGLVIAASVVVTDTTDVRLRIIQSEFNSGFDSGWHTHPGPVIVQVQEGTFKIYQGGCEPIVVHEGDSYIEVPLVPVRAIAKGRIKWTTSQILPVGAAAQELTTDPCE
jgi:quercetin dioxygenase-like cupin family protein